MDIDELRAFLAVARAGSLLAASVELGLPRTTLRRRIESLEARVGAPLFGRDRAGATLTDPGRALLDQGPGLVAQSEAVISVVRESGRQPRGVMRLAVPHGMAPQALVPALALLTDRHRDLRVRVLTHAQPVSLLPGDADLAIEISAVEPAGPFVCRTLATLSERLVASDAYLARHGVPKRPEDLRDHRVFVWDGAPHDGLPLARGGTMVIEPAIVAADIHLLRSLARAGRGIAYVPDGALPEDPAIGGAEVVGVLDKHIRRTLHVRLIVPEVLVRSPSVAAVLALVDELVGLGATLRRNAKKR